MAKNLAISKQKSSGWFGPALLLLGVFYLFVGLGQVDSVSMATMWPALGVIVGLKLMKN